MVEIHYCCFCGEALVLAPELAIKKVPEPVKKCISCKVGFFSGPLNFIVYDGISVIEEAQKGGRPI